MKGRTIVKAVQESIKTYPDRWIMGTIAVVAFIAGAWLL